MRSRTVMGLVAGLVGVLALVATASVPVDARGGGGGHGGGGHGGGGHGGGGHGGGGFHGDGGGGFRGGGGVAFRAAPVFRSATVVRRSHVRYVPRAYGYGYAGACADLRHRAIVTGSSYLWQRYYDCRNGYY